MQLNVVTQAPDRTNVRPIMRTPKPCPCATRQIGLIATNVIGRHAHRVDAIGLQHKKYHILWLTLPRALGP